MRHYEIVLIIHPDQSTQVPDMVDKYQEIILSDGGKVHRMEDWKRRHLAYPINNIYKAHYIMLNIECSQQVLEKLQHNFRFNDAVLRNLIIVRRHAMTEPSVIMAEQDNE